VIAGAMADGARQRGRASIGLSTTGEAGPESQSGKPVGTVFIGLSQPRQKPQTFERSFSGDRDTIRRRAALAALDILRRHLQNQPIGEGAK